MRIQLWSCNYGPEPMGIGPISSIWARKMADRGHEIDVVAAHPHYPEPVWGTKLVAYRETRDGIKITRLPLIIGRDSPRKRIQQEMSFLASQTAAVPFLGKPEAIVSVSPSFPALLPAMMATRIRSIPWFIWLQDILPDGAVTVGYLDETRSVVRWSRRLESAAYRSATGVIVLSNSFRENLVEKGIQDSKISVAYNPATLPVKSLYLDAGGDEPPRVLVMGNIGKSQGLKEVVKDFENNAELETMGARLVIAGSGVAEDEVREAIRTDRVEMTGLLGREQLESQIRRASLAAVTQAYDEGEFNVPSKLMNYLATGLPVIGSVRPSSEAARIIRDSGSGWIAPPREFGSTVANALADPLRLREFAQNGFRFAAENFSPEALAIKFEMAMGCRPSGSLSQDGHDSLS